MEPSSKTIEYLLTCACPGASEFTSKAFSTLVPDALHPVMLVGKQIQEESHRFQDTPLGEALMGISKNKERFSFYIKYDGKNLELWDLKKGIRIP